MTDEILRAPEVAELLKVTEEAAYATAQPAKGAACRLPSSLGLRLRTLDAWIAPQTRGAAGEGAQK
ncbi:putative DNA_binding excisionase [Bradyrhizobium sp. ORS 375]|nr:putative DNA_binding excisionase [Bradyrhizobium sp. ORS 375]